MLYILSAVIEPGLQINKRQKQRFKSFADLMFVPMLALKGSQPDSDIIFQLEDIGRQRAHMLFFG